MDEYRRLPIKQFARDIFLYATYFPLYLNERDYLRPALCIQQAKSAVFEMSSVFSPYMRKYVFEYNERVELKTDEDLLRFLVPKCMRIYTPQNHETLTVVIAFIHEFLLYLQMNRLCYRFHFTAYKCLEAVFNRAEQWTTERWENFWDHARRNLIKASPNSSDQATIDQETLRKNEFKTSIVDLFKKFEGDDDNDDGFDLNNYEHCLIAEDAPDEDDPDEEDYDPFFVDLTPNPDIVKMIARPLQDLRKIKSWRIPISLLLPVPPHSEPRTNSQSDELSRDPSDAEYKSNIETRPGFTNFEIYTSAAMRNALFRYGSKTFTDKLLQRECKYCGIKCYRFSYILFRKQYELAFIG